MLNRVVMQGRLVAHPELKTTRDGTSVCTITLAVERNRLRAGEDRRETDFFDVVCWQGKAEFVSRYFTKGQLVAVEGSLQTRKWTDKYSQPRVNFEIIADNVFFCEGKRDAAPAPAQTYSAGAGYAQPAAVHPTLADSFADVFPDDDDEPF